MLYRFISCSCSSLKELFLVIWFLSFVQWFRIQSVFHLDPWDICLQVEEFRGKENQRRRTSFIKAALKWCTSFLLIFSWWRLLFFFFFSFFFLKDNCFTGFSYFLSNLNMNQPSDQIRSDQWLSRVRLFATPWIAACQASLSITKDDAVKVLHSICQQIWKTQQWPQDWKRSVFIPILKKGSAKECSNYRTIALISHASKVLLKILQARLQQYMNRELPDVQAGFRKGRGTRDQIANIRWIIEKAREFQKNICFCFIDYAKAFDCVDHNKLWKMLKEMGIPDHLICLLRNLYAGQEATVRTKHGTVNWFQIEKEVHQGCIVAVRRVQRKKERAGQSGKKRKFIREKREGDWLLRRTSVLPYDRVILIPHQWKILCRDGHVARGLESGGLAGLKR